MNTTQVVKSTGTVAVSIREAGGIAANDVFVHALRSANLTPSHLWGWSMTTKDDFSGPVAEVVTVVSLYTD